MHYPIELVHLYASRKHRNVTCVFDSSVIHNTFQISATSKYDSGTDRHRSGLSYPDFFLSKRLSSYNTRASVRDLLVNDRTIFDPTASWSPIGEITEECASKSLSIRRASEIWNDTLTVVMSEIFATIDIVSSRIFKELKLISSDVIAICRHIASGILLVQILLMIIFDNLIKDVIIIVAWTQFIFPFS